MSAQGAAQPGARERSGRAAPASQEPPRKSAPAPALDDAALGHLVGYAASRAGLEMRKVFARHMEPLGLRVPEFSILMLVAANDEVNQKQLGQALDISPPNLAVTLDRMAEQGWIERVRSTRDRRAQHIHLTEAGRALAERSRRISATMEEPALAVLSRAERALLIELLRKIVPRAGDSGA